MDEERPATVAELQLCIVNLRNELSESRQELEAAREKLVQWETYCDSQDDEIATLNSTISTLRHRVEVLTTARITQRVADRERTRGEVAFGRTQRSPSPTRSTKSTKSRGAAMSVRSARTARSSKSARSTRSAPAGARRVPKSAPRTTPHMQAPPPPPAVTPKKPKPKQKQKQEPYTPSIAKSGLRFASVGPAQGVSFSAADVAAFVSKIDVTAFQPPPTPERAVPAGLPEEGSPEAQAAARLQRQREMLKKKQTAAPAEHSREAISSFVRASINSSATAGGAAAGPAKPQTKRSSPPRASPRASPPPQASPEARKATGSRWLSRAHRAIAVQRARHPRGALLAAERPQLPPVPFVQELDDDLRELLVGALQRSPFAASLRPEHLVTIASDMEQTAFDPGQTVPIDCYCVVDSGLFCTEAGQEVRPDEGFGEARLLGPSAALDERPLRCVEAGVAWLLHGDRFRMNMRACAERDAAAQLQVLAGVPLFAALPRERLHALSGALTLEEFAAGEDLVEQGAVNDAFRLVQAGRVRAHEVGGAAADEDEAAGGVMNVLRKMGPGDFEGEHALLADTVMHYALTAQTDALVWVLRRADWERVSASPAAAADSCVTPGLPAEANPALRNSASWPGEDDLERVQLVARSERTGAKVHVVQHKKTGVYYALKSRPRAGMSAAAREFADSERAILRELRFQPFVVHLLDTCADARAVYYLFELARGGDLGLLLAGVGALPPAQARFYGASVAAALVEVHALGVVHRGVQPDNVLVDANGYARLAGFGAAKRIGAERTYTLCGAVEYAAPEALRGAGYGREADLWALGVLLWEAMGDRSPFFVSGGSPADTLARIAAAEEAPPAPDHLPPEAADLLRRLLDPRPLRRPTAAGALAHAFFEPIDLAALRARIPSAPHVPVVSGPDDAAYLDELVALESDGWAEDESGWVPFL